MVPMARQRPRRASVIDSPLQSAFHRQGEVHAQRALTRAVRLVFAQSEFWGQL